MTELARWTEANKQYLLAALARIRGALEQRAGREVDEAALNAALERSRRALPAPAALDRLSEAFRLSPFERDVVVLCAGVELDAGFASLCRQLGGPTFSLALATFPDAHWSALTSASPLRHWRLVEIDKNETIAGSPLRLDERILHFLAGVGSLDEQLADIVVTVPVDTHLPASHAALAERIARHLSTADDNPLICLSGQDRWARRAVAAQACANVGLSLHLLRASEIARTPAERTSMARLWERESHLHRTALLIDVDDADGSDAIAATLAFAERLAAPLFVAAREPVRPSTRPAVHIEVAKPTSSEQRALWRSNLPPAPARDEAIDRVVSHFQLSTRDIVVAARGLLTDDAEVSLWEACRRQARPRIEDLAQRMTLGAEWRDLVLPAPTMQALGEIAIQVRQRSRVYETWGLGRRGSRGLGISVLFHGASGTGKTLAAEVIAGELELDLYRIDLSQVVSKYIGETEKNLRRVFDAAEEGGAVLLFDEADALFGKRTEVKDSHDRYANIEVSYLLQRMEAYRGLAILTTNQKQALDPAFLRRLRFVVHFPFPAAEERAAIWAGIFPVATPTVDLHVEKLARLTVAGGNIRNIALGAAFLAADEGNAVAMSHLLRAARAEYAKIDRPLSDGEIRGWA